MTKNYSTEAEKEKLTPLPDAADRLGLSVWTLRDWIQNGKIASNKLGRRRLIPVSEIERLIKESHVPARAVAA